MNRVRALLATFLLGLLMSSTALASEEKASRIKIGKIEFVPYQPTILTCLNPKRALQVLEGKAAEGIRSIMAALPKEHPINSKDPRMKSNTEFARYVARHFQGRPPSEIHQTLRLIRSASLAFKLPEQLLGCMFMKESSLNEAVPPNRWSGAVGMTQVMPKTAEFVNSKMLSSKDKYKVFRNVNQGWDAYWRLAEPLSPVPETFTVSDLKQKEFAIGVGGYIAKFSAEQIQSSIGPPIDSLDGWALTAGAYNDGPGIILKNCPGATIFQCLDALKALKAKGNCETYLYVARVRDCMETKNERPLTDTSDCRVDPQSRSPAKVSASAESIVKKKALYKSKVK